MVNYRRNYTPGAYYFFTVALKNKKSYLLIQYIQLLRQAMRHTLSCKPYKTIAIVILPEHLHVIWKLPDGDINYPTRWRMIKSYFIRSLRQAGIPLTKNFRGEYQVWQRRYWEHTIRDDLDLSRHIDYIHYNPLKHKLVKKISDWPYSSFHADVQRGAIDKNRGANYRIILIFLENKIPGFRATRFIQATFYKPQRITFFFGNNIQPIIPNAK